MKLHVPGFNCENMLKCHTKELGHKGSHVHVHIQCMNTPHTNLQIILHRATTVIGNLHLKWNNNNNNKNRTLTANTWINIPERTPPPPMSIFNILVEAWCSAGHFLWRMAPAIAMNSVTPADTSKKPDLQKLYPLDREVRTVRQRPQQVYVCKYVCVIYCAVFHWHILQIIDYCLAVISIEAFADLKSQTLRA